MKDDDEGGGEGSDFKLFEGLCRLSNKQINNWTDIGDYRVASMTENTFNIDSLTVKVFLIFNLYDFCIIVRMDPGPGGGQVPGHYCHWCCHNHRN